MRGIGSLAETSVGAGCTDLSYNGPMSRTVDGAAAREVLARFGAGDTLTRAELRLAARYALAEFARLHPGRSVEVRLPPAAVVQAIAGPAHTRGTPPNVVETRPEVWLELALGKRSWQDACASGDVQWSGTRADLGEYLPYV